MSGAPSMGRGSPTRPLAATATPWPGLSSASPVFALEASEPTATVPSSTAAAVLPADRKSTRLNSSHSQISYAVFCLKKKKTNTYTSTDGPTDLIIILHDAGTPASGTTGTVTYGRHRTSEMAE